MNKISPSVLVSIIVNLFTRFFNLMKTSKADRYFIKNLENNSSSDLSRIVRTLVEIVRVGYSTGGWIVVSSSEQYRPTDYQVPHSINEMIKASRIFTSPSGKMRRIPFFQVDDWDVDYLNGIDGEKFCSPNAMKWFFDEWNSYMNNHDEAIINLEQVVIDDSICSTVHDLRVVMVPHHIESHRMYSWNEQGSIGVEEIGRAHV